MVSQSYSVHKKKSISRFFSGENGNCSVPSLGCNCDAKDPVWAEDTGIITEKSKLPITAFMYNPIEFDLQEASISISSLKCRGISNILNIK